MTKEVSRRSYLKYAAAGVVAVGAAAAGLYAGTQFAPAPQEKIEIRMLVEETAPPTVAELNRTSLEYEDLTGVRLRVEPVYMGGLGEVIPAAIAAGKLPEIISGGGGGTRIALAIQGQLEPVTSSIDKIGRDKFYDTAIKQATYKDEMYAWPLDVEPNMFWYRKDLFEEHGLPMPPRTWDDWLNAARTLNDPPNMYGTVLPLEYAVLAETFDGLYWSNNGLYCDANLNTVMDKEPYLSRFKETVEFCKELLKYSPPGVANYSYPETYTAFTSESVATCPYWARVLEVMSRTNPSMLTRYGCCPMPIPAGGMMATEMWSEGMAVFKNSPHPKAALDFFDWWTESEAFMRYLHTVPGLFWPARKDTAESEAFLGNQLLQENPQVVETLREIIPTGYTPMTEPNGTINTGASSWDTVVAIGESVAAMALNRESYETGIPALAEKYRKIITLE